MTLNDVGVAVHWLIARGLVSGEYGRKGHLKAIFQRRADGACPFEPTVHPGTCYSLCEHHDSDHIVWAGEGTRSPRSGLCQRRAPVNALRVIAQHDEQSPPFLWRKLVKGPEHSLMNLPAIRLSQPNDQDPVMILISEQTETFICGDQEALLPFCDPPEFLVVNSLIRCAPDVFQFVSQAPKLLNGHTGNILVNQELHTGRDQSSTGVTCSSAKEAT